MAGDCLILTGTTMTSLENIRAAVASLRTLRKTLARKHAGKPKLTAAQFKFFVNEGRR